MTAVGVFPKLPVPGVFEDRELTEEVRTTGVLGIRVAVNDGVHANPAARAGVAEIRIPIAYHPVPFMRLLAKIGWGFTVAKFGLGVVEPHIVGIVLGSDHHIAHWVGFPPEGQSLFDGPPEHEFRVTVHNNDNGWVLAGVQLFGPQGGPEYLVVVGQFR